MAPRRREEVGLEADGEEDRVAVEAGGELGPRCRVGMDAAERGADARGDRDVGVAFAQHLLPQAVLVRGEPGHDEDAEPRMLAEHARRRAGLRRVRDFEPARLVAIAIDGRAPVGGDPQLGEGALGAHRAALGVDAPDVGRDSAGERRADEALAGSGEAELDQRLREFGRHLDARLALCSGGRHRRHPAFRADSTSLTSACSAWLAGVATPSAAPRRATKPLR